jgi:hypothetical protein
VTEMYRIAVRNVDMRDRPIGAGCEAIYNQSVYVGFGSVRVKYGLADGGCDVRY